MNFPRITLGVSLLVLAAALAGCETTGTGTAAAVAAKPPMTHARAATECWMGTEKAHTDLDKRADIVTKCIDQKMKAADDAPKS
jgi:Spy/CpxP family protein refolding chaperone